MTSLLASDAPARAVLAGGGDSPSAAPPRRNHPAPLESNLKHIQRFST